MNNYGQAFCKARDEADRLGVQNFYLFHKGGDWKWAFHPQGFGVKPDAHYALEPGGTWFRTGLNILAAQA